MTKVFSSFLMISTVVLSGCRVDFSAELNATESLLKVVEKVEASSGQIDARLVKQYVNDVLVKCESIQSQLSDTLSLEQAEVLVNFCSLDEHLTNCLGRKERIDEEILRTRSQLFNLKTDLIERRADKDSANHYIEQEFLFVESLNESTDQLLVELNGCFETYAELKDEIDRLLIELPSKVE